jgi:hypothetical protein
MPNAAHSNSEIVSSESARSLYARTDWRFAKACISGEPPSLLGGGNLMVCADAWASEILAKPVANTAAPKSMLRRVHSWSMVCSVSTDAAQENKA